MTLIAWQRLRLLGAVLLMAIGSSAGQSQPAQTVPLTLDAIFAPEGITGPQPESIEWSPDSSKVSYIQRDASGGRPDLWVVDVATGNKSVLIPSSKLSSLLPRDTSPNDFDQELVRRHGSEPYQWSPDSQHLLFRNRGQLWFYSLETGVAFALTSSPDPSMDPQFSPDGKRVAFVRATDLWTRSPDEPLERQLTRKSENEENVLVGGISWVYAKELGVRGNFSWSPDGRQIAFLQVDERGVPTYPHVDWSSNQATVVEQKYPQPGDVNPVVRVGVVSSGGGRVRYVELPNERGRDYYIPRFGWVNERTLYLEVLDRSQKTLTLYFADPESGRSQPVLTEEAPDSWVYPSYDIVFPSPGKFLWTSWRSGNSHIYLYGFEYGSPLSGEAWVERQLTSGDFQVLDVNAFDEKTQSVYFTANADDPREAHLYAVGLDGAGLRRISRAPGTHSVMFSPDTTRYVSTFSSLLTPPRLSLCDISGNCVPIWQAPEISATLPLVRELELKAADGQSTLFAYLLLPRHADQAAPRSMPIVLNPSGGPDQQGVRHGWGKESFLFNALLTEENGCAILIVDNRGTPNRGRKFATAIRGELGNIELQDQFAALDQVLERYPMLDPDRVAMYGSGYGGFLTLYAMTHSDRIRAGVAVSSISNWDLYDSIFTERYLGSPRTNAAGYDRSSPLQFAQKLSGRLLLVHGTADMDVHVQNTYQMIDAFAHADIDFDLHLYFGSGSNLPESAVRKHLYNRVQRHLYQWLRDDRY